MVKNTFLKIRCTEQQREQIKQNAIKQGFKGISDYLLYLGLNAEVTKKIEIKGNE
jgi:hypothetical protein